MRKREFLLELEDKLQGIDINEKRNIINYYDELISDKVESGQDEERIVRNLGSIEDICRKLSIETNKKIRIQYDSLIEEEIAKTEHLEKKEKIPSEETSKTKKGNRSVLSIIFLIVLFPFWFALLMICISLIIAASAFIFAFAVAGIAIVASALFEIVISIPMFAVDVYAALFNIGASLILLAVGLILSPLMIRGGKILAKQLGKFIKYLGKLIGGKLREN